MKIRQVPLHQETIAEGASKSWGNATAQQLMDSATLPAEPFPICNERNKLAVGRVPLL